MLPEENKATVKRFGSETFSNGNLVLSQELLAADITDQLSMLQQLDAFPPTGQEAEKRLMDEVKDKPKSP
jgi:hypothetical protein